MILDEKTNEVLSLIVNRFVELNNEIVGKDDTEYAQQQMLLYLNELKKLPWALKYQFDDDSKYHVETMLKYALMTLQNEATDEVCYIAPKMTNPISVAVYSLMRLCGCSDCWMKITSWIAEYKDKVDEKELQQLSEDYKKHRDSQTDKNT